MAILSIGELLGMGPSELSGLIPFSGLGYSGTAITGISGSAIGGAGGVPGSSVSAIASSYAESAASSRVYQSAFDDCCSAVDGALSGISAAVSGVTGQTGNYIDWSSSGAFQPSGNYQPSGDYAFNSSLSGKLDTSASSSWYPMEGNPSGFLTEHQSLSGYATEGYVDSSVSGKLDASAVNFDGDSSHVTGISGVPLSAQGGAGDCKIVYDASGNIYNSGAANVFNSGWGAGDCVVYGSANSATDYAVVVGMKNDSDEGVNIGFYNTSYGFAPTTVGSANLNLCDSVPGGVFGANNSAGKACWVIGSHNSAARESNAIGIDNTATDDSLAIGLRNGVSTGSTAMGYYNTADDYTFLCGNNLSGTSGAVVFGQYNLNGSAALALADGTWTPGGRHDLLLVTKDGEIRTYSSTADTIGLPIIATLRAISAWATANGWTGM